MRTRRIALTTFLSLTLLLSLGQTTTPPAPTTPLPPDAREVLDTFEHDRAKLLEELEAKLHPKCAELIAQLKLLQDRYTKAAQLDEAVAIRDTIRRIIAEFGGSEPDYPLVDIQNFTPYRDRIGKVLYVSVLGTSSGTVWGTDIYTDDSPLAAAAVHAGLLAPDQRGTVKVTLRGPQDGFTASTRNGITAAAWGPYPGSYTLEKPR